MEFRVMSDVLSGLFFLTLGLWHLVSSSSTFIRSPSAFSARAWHPLPPHRLSRHAKLLELYLLLAVLPLSIGYELIISADFDPLVQGSTPTYRMVTLLRVGMLLMFVLFVLIAIFSEATSLLPLPPEASFIFAAAAFASQWKVLKFEAQITSGLEGECDSLLATIAGICAVVSGLLAWQPKLFLADMILNMGILLQGLWRLQTGLSLHVDAFIPQGCHRLLDVVVSVEGSTRCDVESYKMRAIALMDLLFICHAVFVVLITVVVYGVVAKAHGARRYVSLNALSPGSDCDRHRLQMKPFPDCDL